MIGRAVCIALAVCAGAPALAAGPTLDTVQDRVCHMVEAAAAASRLPAGFLTRVL